MAEFYSARSWEIPPLPWTNLSSPFSVHLRFQINFNEVTVLYATWRFAKSDSMIRISTTLKCRLKAATMPSESLLGIAGDISASTCTELSSGKWVHTTYSGCG